MFYTCCKCHYTFPVVGEVNSCPDCGKTEIREATEQEQAGLLDNCTAIGYIGCADEVEQINR